MADVDLHRQTRVTAPLQVGHKSADDLGMAPNQVNVKATTTEGMGYTGRSEGIAAHAVVLLTAS